MDDGPSRSHAKLSQPDGSSASYGIFDRMRHQIKTSGVKQPLIFLDSQDDEYADALVNVLERLQASAPHPQ